MTSKEGLGIITGKTEVYAFIAHPAFQARSPEVINPMFRERGVDAVMVSFDVPPDDLAGAIRTFGAISNFKGLIISVPLKPLAIAYADVLSKRAEAIGGINLSQKTV